MLARIVSIVSPGRPDDEEGERRDAVPAEQRHRLDELLFRNRLALDVLLHLRVGAFHAEVHADASRLRHDRDRRLVEAVDPGFASPLDRSAPRATISSQIATTRFLLAEKSGSRKITYCTPRSRTRCCQFVDHIAGRSVAPRQALADRVRAVVAAERAAARRQHRQEPERSGRGRLGNGVAIDRHAGPSAGTGARRGSSRTCAPDSGASRRRPATPDRRSRPAGVPRISSSTG